VGLSDPSEIRALDFKEEFRRYGIWSVSATIGDDWFIFYVRGDQTAICSSAKYRQLAFDHVTVDTYHVEASFFRG
jgi:hypothetical protein